MPSSTGALDVLICQSGPWQYNYSYPSPVLYFTFSLHHLLFHRSSNFTSSFSSISFKIFILHTRILQLIFAVNIFKILTAKIKKSNEYKINNVKFIHKKKLGDLGAEPHSGVDDEKVIFNFSNRILTSNEKDVLKLGLDFGFIYSALLGLWDISW